MAVAPSSATARGRGAVLLLRRSTDMQEHSIEGQRGDLKRLAAELGVEAVREFVDDGVSGS